MEKAKTMEAILDKQKNRYLTTLPDPMECSETTEEMIQRAKNIPTAIKMKQKTANKGIQLQILNMADIIEKPEKIIPNPFFINIEQALYHESAIILILNGYDLTVTFSDDGGSTRISWVDAKEWGRGTIRFYNNIKSEKLIKIAADWGYVSKLSPREMLIENREYESKLSPRDMLKANIIGKISSRCVYSLSDTFLRPLEIIN